MFNSISTQSHNDPNTSSAIHNFPPYHSAAIYDCISLHHRHNINNVIELQPQTILNPSSSEHHGNLITSTTTIQTKEEKCSNFFPDSGNNGSKRAKRDRHTKISTAHGVRDRRVRLSMGIAREFFDLQDMLGFDKASMTLAWLLAHSRHAIQEVAAVKASRYCPVVPTTAGSSTPCIKDHKSLKEMPRESTSAACIITSCSSARQAARAGGARSSSVVVKEKRAKARERARERVREKLYSKLGQQQQQRGVAGMAYRTNATAPSLQHYPALSLSSSAGANNGRSGTQELEIKRQGHVDVPTQLCTRGFNEYTAPYHHHRSSLQSFCVPFHQDRTVQDQLMSARGTFNFPDLSLGTNEADVGMKRQDVDIPPTQGYTTGFNGSTNNAAVKPYHHHHHRTPVLQNCCVSLFQDVGSDHMAAARSGTLNFPAGLYLGSNDAQMNSSFSALDFDAARL